MQKKAVTAKDVAAECGVSQATVSYVINDKSDKRISPETRHKVLEAAQKLNYYPSSSARSMRNRRAMAIGVITGGNNISLGFNKALSGIKSALDQAGYSIVLLSDEFKDANGELNCISYYRSGRIDGLLALFSDLSSDVVSELQANGIPYLSLSEQGVWSLPESPEESSDAHKAAGSGYAEAIEDCVRLCRDKGFRRIRFFSFQYGERLYSFKYDIFKYAMERCYPQAEFKRIVTQIEGLDNHQILEQIIYCVRADEFDIAITPHARLGLLVQNCILREHFEIPQRIRHICLSTAHAFSMAYPSITNIEVPLTEMGEFAAAQLLRMLSGEELEHRCFKCTLDMGMSTL